jgi:hypothetical protein
MSNSLVGFTERGSDSLSCTCIVKNYCKLVAVFNMGAP